MQFTNEELKGILQKHEEWLRGAESGERANLAHANLRSADLAHANLAGADLAHAGLTGAGLTGANLAHANLRSADLAHANLAGAGLTGADLVGAGLTGADLTGADLTGAYLAHADLAGAGLTGASLAHANLRSANLTGADLTGADLTGADLDYSTLYFACESLSAKFSNKIIIQILYHAAAPAQHNALDLDDDVKALFNSELFKTVVNKFHRVEECGAFTGCKEKEREL